MFSNRLTKSIRGELTLKLLIGSFVLFFSFGAIFFVVLKRNFTAQFDQTLLVTARALVSYTEVEGRVVVFELPGDMEGRFTEGPSAEYFHIGLTSGASVARSPSLGLADLSNGQTGVDGKPHFHDLLLPDGRPGRVLAMVFEPEVDEESEDDEDDEASDDTESRIEVPGDVQISTLLWYAASRERLDTLVGTTLVALLGVGILLPVGTLLLVRFVVSRALSSSDRLAQTIETVDPADLSHRFSTSDLPDELAPLALRLNELMNRVEQTMERERRFTADAAHELRTPVSELRTLSEVGLAELDLADPDSKHAAGLLQDVHQAALQMGRIVEALLVIARNDNGGVSLRFEKVELTGLIKDTFKAYWPDPLDKRLEYRLEIPESLPITTDRTILSATLNNLVSNAVRYSPAGSLVRCEASCLDGLAVIRVINTHLNLEQEDLPHLFEPFWRKSSARSSQHHSGLGLSLVNNYIKLLGGEIQTGLEPMSQFTVEIRLPGSGNERTSPTASYSG